MNYIWLFCTLKFEYFFLISLVSRLASYAKAELLMFIFLRYLSFIHFFQTSGKLHNDGQEMSFSPGKEAPHNLSVEHVKEITTPGLNLIF